jgi:polyhydroxyalkanoate synthesis regulator phasin
VPPRQSRKPSSRSRSTKSTAKTTSSTRSRRPAATTAEAPAGEGVREQLQRLLNPLELVVLTHERVQGALDEAVERGRMTRQDASDLAGVLLSRRRRQTDELLAELESLVGRATGAGSEARKRVTAPADRVIREVDRARRAAGIGPSFPIVGYDDLTSAQVQARLGDLTPAELRKVRDYERRNANRKSVLGAIEQKLD